MNWGFAGGVAVITALTFWVGWTTGRRHLTKKILARWPFVRADMESVDPEVRDIDKPAFPKLIWLGFGFLYVGLIAGSLQVIWPE